MTNLHPNPVRRPRPSTRRPAPRLAAPEAGALAFGAALVLAAGGALVHAAAWPVVALAVAGALACGLGTISTLPAALLAAAAVWGCYTGFVLGHAGQLVFDGRSAVAFAVLAMTAVAGCVGGSAVRAIASAGRRTRWAAPPGRIPLPRTAAHSR